MQVSARPKKITLKNRRRTSQTMSEDIRHLFIFLHFIYLCKMIPPAMILVHNHHCVSYLLIRQLLEKHRQHLSKQSNSRTKNQINGIVFAFLY
jgi:hypothetical protein